MNKILDICIVFAIALVVEGDVRCRVCNHATDLKGCTSYVDCNAGELCFMEEVINVNTGILSYNAGCRTKEGCPKNQISTGRKRRDTDPNYLTSCLTCCSRSFNTTTRTSCNEELCKIPQGNYTGNCYKCGTFTPEVGVTDIQSCSTVVECEPNEMCRSTKYEESGVDHFIFGCFRKERCRFLGERALIQYALFHNLPAPPSSRRVRMCDMCCGDGLCNNADCTFITERLYNQWGNGTLDLNTLETNTTKP